MTGLEGLDAELLPEAGGARYLVARSADTRVAIPLAEAREIIATRVLTRLPGAPTWIAGLLNLRGTVLTVVDLDARLGGSAAAGPVVVVEREGRTFGVRVSAVEAVQGTGGEELPVDAARAAGGVVRGLVPVGERPALVVDVAALLRTALADATGSNS